MNWLDYRKKLGIGFSDDKKASILANNVSAYIRHNITYSSKELLSFCMITGNEYYPSGDDCREDLCAVFEAADSSLKEIISLFVAFLNVRNSMNKHGPNKDLLFISGRLSYIGIPFEIEEDSDGFFIFPKGVPAFDDALVSAPLQWLSAYPKSEKAWSKALREYSESNGKNASDIADLFRKALETFFQEFFKSDKTLENLKTEYGAFLKIKGVAKEISSNFEALLQAYTNYMNNYAKHRDATSDKVLEYLMYQTGNIIRLLITL